MMWHNIGSVTVRMPVVIFIRQPPQQQHAKVVVRQASRING
jgi:hypothetical protein